MGSIQEPDSVMEHIQNLVALARDTSPYYAGLYSSVLQAPQSLSDLPLVDHEGYWAASTSDRRLVMSAAQMDGVIMKTGGTTSKPKMTAYSQIDLQRTATLLAKGLLAGGVRAGDRIANMFYAGDLYASFLLHVVSIMALPVPAVHVPIGGFTSAPAAADLLQQCDVTALLSTATFLVKLATHLTSQAKVNDRVRCIMFGGEPLFPEQQASIRLAFPNATIRSCIYGSIDAGVLATASDQSDHDSSVHRVLSEGAVLEILRQDGSDSVIESNDEPGMLVATSLHRTLCPVIRYPTGDRAAWVDKHEGTFRLLGRAGLGVRLGPVSIDIGDLRRVAAKALAAQNTALQGSQAVLRQTPSGLDQLELLIAADPQDSKLAAEAVETYLYEERPMFKQHVELSRVAPLVVRFVQVGDLHLAPGSHKLLSVVDQRFPTLTGDAPGIKQ